MHQVVKRIDIVNIEAGKSTKKTNLMLMEQSLYGYQKLGLAALGPRHIECALSGGVVDRSGAILDEGIESILLAIVGH